MPLDLSCSKTNPKHHILVFNFFTQLNGLMRHTKVAHSKSSSIIDVGVLLEKYCPKLELEFKVSVFDVFIVSTVSSQQQKF